MRIAQLLVWTSLALTLGAAGARAQFVIPEPAAERSVPAMRQCLDERARRVAIEEKRVLPLAKAIRRVQRRPGELVNARLCQEANGLVYVLTLLPRDGKVTRATVDATSGRVITGR